jgi:NitT/TauT family transport system substrate-binding protein
MNRSTVIRLIAATALTATLALRGGAPPAVAQTLPVIHIALIPSDIAAEVYYAKEQGFFKKAGYDVEFTPITSGAAISSAVAGGSADIGFSNVVSLSIAHDKGLPFTLIAPANLHVPTQVTAGILTALKSSPMKTGKDLAGKVVAVNGLNNISSVSVQAYVDKNGGDWKSVKFVEMPFPAMPDAVRSGRVDAASIDAANEQLLMKPDSDLKRLANVFDSVGTHFTPSCWFTTTSWANANPAAARAFVTVMAETAVWANANHAASAAILATYLKKTPADIAEITRAPYATKLTPDLVQPSIDAAFKYGLIKAAFPAAELISPLAK